MGYLETTDEDTKPEERTPETEDTTQHRRSNNYREDRKVWFTRGGNRTRRLVK
jgi:hypothetical protein